jgi:hypothetical protein
VYYDLAQLIALDSSKLIQTYSHVADLSQKLLNYAENNVMGLKTKKSINQGIVRKYQG